MRDLSLRPHRRAPPVLSSRFFAPLPFCPLPTTTSPEIHLPYLFLSCLLLLLLSPRSSSTGSTETLKKHIDQAQQSKDPNLIKASSPKPQQTSPWKTPRKTGTWPRLLLLLLILLFLFFLLLSTFLQSQKRQTKSSQTFTQNPHPPKNKQNRKQLAKLGSITHHRSSPIHFGSQSSSVLHSQNSSVSARLFFYPRRYYNNKQTHHPSSLERASEASDLPAPARATTCEKKQGPQKRLSQHPPEALLRSRQ